MKSANVSIRQKAKESGVMFWEIADVLNVSESTFTRMMRKEVSPDKAKRILNIIDNLSCTKEGDKH